ncbi:hypothetical protein [Actinomadura sp. DC4]|uniref:hypothetical protein n=1 Tax=Actinomadura sp. DC4 TaxID=3055069 RepID=UPI0025AEF7CB|nr:hypothetical protein [Actinomadura sp. DC4]MDN3359643.1 hypothetical protein [Actinomadura sp. DC4]
MNTIINWLDGIAEPDDLEKVAIKLFFGNGVFVALFLIFVKVKSWLDFAASTKKSSVKAYRAAADLAGTYTSAKALLTALAAVGLTFWVLSVQEMTNLALYLMVRMQENNWSYDIASLDLPSILHGANWGGYDAVTRYALPAAILALVLLAVGYHSGGGFLARAIFVVLGLIANAPMLFIGILTIVTLLKDFLTHGIHLFGQGDNLSWDLVITAGLALYIASFFIVDKLVGKVRQLWGLPIRSPRLAGRR